MMTLPLLITCALANTVELRADGTLELNQEHHPHMHHERHHERRHEKRRIHSYMEQGEHVAPTKAAIDPQRAGAMDNTKHYKSALDKKFKKLDEDGQRWESWNMEQGMAGSDVPAYLDGICAELEIQASEMQYAIMESVTLQRATVDTLRENLKPIMNQASKDDLTIISDMESIVENLEKDLKVLDEHAKVSAGKVEQAWKLNEKDGQQQAAIAARIGERTLNRVTDPGILTRCTAACTKCQQGLEKWKGTDGKLAKKAEKYKTNCDKWSAKCIEVEKDMSDVRDESANVAMNAEALLKTQDDNYMTIQSQQDEELESIKNAAELATSAAEDLSDVEVTKAETKSGEAITALEDSSEASALKQEEAVDQMTEAADEAVADAEEGARAGEDDAAAAAANGVTASASAADQAAVEAEALTAQKDELGVSAEQLSQMTQEEVVAFLKKVMDQRSALKKQSQEDIEEVDAAFDEASGQAKSEAQNKLTRDKDESSRLITSQVQEDEVKMSSKQRVVDAASDDALHDIGEFIGGMGSKLQALIEADRDEEKATTREGKDAEKMRSTLIKYASKALAKLAQFAAKEDRRAAMLEQDADKTSQSERNRIEQEKGKSLQGIVAAATSALKLVQQTNTAAKQQVLGATSQALDPGQIVSQVEKIEGTITEIENEEIGESFQAVQQQLEKASAKVEQIVPSTEEEMKRAEETVLKDTTALSNNQDTSHTSTEQTITSLAANGVKKLTDLAEKLEGEYAALGETVDAWKTDQGTKLTSIEEQVHTAQDGDDTEKKATAEAIAHADTVEGNAAKMADDAENRGRVSVEQMGEVTEEDINAATSRAKAKEEEVLNAINKLTADDKGKLQSYINKQNADTGAKLLDVIQKITEQQNPVNPTGVAQANRMADSSISQNKQVFDANAADITTTVSDMNKDINKWQARAEDEMGQYREQLSANVQRAKNAVTQQGEDKAEQANKLVEETVKLENNKQAIAEEEMKKLAVSLQQTLGEDGELFEKKKAELLEAEDAVDKDTDKVNSEGESAISGVLTQSQAAKANFQAALGRDAAAQGGAVAKLADRSGEVEQEILDGETGAVLESGEKKKQWNQEGQDLVESIDDEAHKDKREWKKMGKGQERLKSDTADVDKKTEEIEKETDEDESKEMEEVQKFAQAFISTLEHTKKKRIDIANQVGTETRDLLTKSNAGLGSWRALADHVTGHATAAVANVAADERQLDRGLEDLLKLEEYQDASALEKVQNDQKAFSDNLDNMQNWRDKTTQATSKFRADVKDLFGDLNAELNVEELENSEATSAENWHIQRQMAELAAGLDNEIGDLDSSTQLQLAKLAKQSGQEIARLMASNEHSEEEKAKMIQKLKEDARARARKLLDANGRVDLDATTNKRKLEAATKEVQDAIGRIASMDSTKLSFSKDTHISEAMDTIKDLVAQTNAMITQGAPPTGGDNEGGDSLLQTRAGRRGAELRELRQAQVEDAEVLANLRKSRA